MSKRTGARIETTSASSTSSDPVTRARGAGKAPLLGAHVSTAGGFGRAIDRAISIGCNAAQIFVKNNMQWMAPPLAEADVRQFTEHPGRALIHSLFGHSGYLINIAATGPNRQRSINSLLAELERADRLGLPFLVLHPGAHLGKGIERGLVLAARALNEVFARHPVGRCKIALETTAGQGTCLGHEIEQLPAIRAMVSEPHRVCYCLDTAHLFAAGYDLSTEQATRSLFKKIGRTLGISRIAAIHMNDSKTPRGSRIDRHEHIGKGAIGLAAFSYIMRDPSLTRIPKVLETPKGVDMAEDLVNLEVLRQMANA